ncbi:flagellar biosynthetic protein FliO [Propionivibrio limicola]|uniref:flagellar biosynthetic protein FliO n=1 Tax=Propionivibrio limicola TaxID=167645 RepID=UPI00129171B5|nr:flagellar biosynthetic protein FliO [Propionivibrio limicola]
MFPSRSIRPSPALALLVLLFSNYAPALAQTNVVETPGVSASAIAQMLLGLGLIVAVLFVGAYFMRQLNGGRAFGHTGPLKIVGGLMIGTRERIVLLEVENTWIVVGIVPGQIKTLHTLPKGELPPGEKGEMPFGKWLKQMSERKHEPR